MNVVIVYPRWSKLERQTAFHLPPHGPVVFAAALPDDVQVELVDENVETLDFDRSADLVCISMMLTSQVKRGWAIADEYRRRGIPVLCGGIATMLHADETQAHADSVFLGEAEGRMQQVLDDFRAGRLAPRYDFLNTPAPIDAVGPARRSILRRDLYNYRGVQMVDLVHASRGCRFSCYPCCVSYLGGRTFRPRPIDRVVAEIAGIDNGRLFFVDNSLAQDKAGSFTCSAGSSRSRSSGARTRSRTTTKCSRPLRAPAPGTSTRRSSTRRISSAGASSATTPTASPSKARSCSVSTTSPRTTSGGSWISCSRSSSTWPSSRYWSRSRTRAPATTCDRRAACSRTTGTSTPPTRSCSGLAT